MSRTLTFWETVPKPFLALAPMADVTDVAFRSMFARHGKPDVFWTEFVSADGLCSPGRESLRVDLLFEADQRPIVAQLFTSNPDCMYRAACFARDLGFDGIDINMGCPDRSIEKQGSGANLIRNPDQALAIIRAAKQVGLPVSVKTRIGYNTDEIETWLPILLKEKIAALSVHLRTRQEMSKVPAHWDYMPRIVSLRNSIAPETLVIGNGDVQSREEAYERARESGCDGVMVGRGIFGNPWFFNKSLQEKTAEEKLNALIEHIRLFEEKLPMKSFAIMKKHYKAYIQGFDGAKELRILLLEQTENGDSAVQSIKYFLKKQNSN